ncbi:putative Tic20 family protein [Pseudomonas frederiksbergensis]
MTSNCRYPHRAERFVSGRCFVTCPPLLGIWLPFGTLIGPLILWQMKRESDPFIDAQGKEALNFQITVAIASAICFLLMVVIIGFFLFGLVAIGALVLTIIAGVKANEGFPYRYPFTWRLIK